MEQKRLFLTLIILVAITLAVYVSANKNLFFQPAPTISQDSLTFGEYGDCTFDKNPLEQCDDGNLIDGDGCSSQAKYEYCGDGVLQLGLGEQCEPGQGYCSTGQYCKTFGGCTCAPLIRGSPPSVTLTASHAFVDKSPTPVIITANAVDSDGDLSSFFYCLGYYPQPSGGQCVAGGASGGGCFPVTNLPTLQSSHTDSRTFNLGVSGTMEKTTTVTIYYDDAIGHRSSDTIIIPEFTN
jgi:cysteine-rich repeat protein